MFHTDRGKEFDNKLINQALKTFGIDRSLSEKDSPYDNAVAEATFKSIKTEFVYGRVFFANKNLILIFLITLIGLIIFVFMDL